MSGARDRRRAPHLTAEKENAAPGEERRSDAAFSNPGTASAAALSSGRPFPGPCFDVVGGPVRVPSG
jgi:hypothetical protein